MREQKNVPAAPSAPVTETTEKPAPPAVGAPKPIPTGGSVTAQSVDGAIVRTELANGVVLVVRENPATSVASIVTAVRLPNGVEPARALEFGRSVSTSGADSPSAKASVIGGTIEVSTDGAVLFFTTSVLVGDSDAAVTAHAGLFAAQPAGNDPPLLSTERTTVVLSGRVNSFQTLTTVQREFGGIEKPEPLAPPAVQSGGKKTTGRQPAPAVAVPPAPAAQVVAAPFSRFAVRSGSAGTASALFTFEPPGDGQLDGVVVEVLAAALGVGRTSRLGLASSDPAVAVDAAAKVVWRNARRGLAVSLAAEPPRLDDASAAVWKEIDRLRSERLTDAELQRARNQAELDDVLRRSRPDEDALDLARLEIGTRDVKASSSLRRRLGTVTASEVQSVAAGLISLKTATIVETIPPGAPARPASMEAYAARVAQWAPGIQREVRPADVVDRAAMPAAPEGEDRSRSGERADSVLVPVPLPVRDFSTLNGPKAFVREDASQPVVSIGFFFPSGRVAETPANRGITELMLRAMVRGSKKFSGDALLFAIERLGGRVRIVNEADFFGVVVEVLSRNADLVVPVAIDLVESPQFETGAVNREKVRLLADQRPSRMEPSAIAANLFWQGRYPTHSYGIAAEGLPETISKQTEESVRDWYAKSVRALYPLVGIVGDTDGSSLVSRYVVEGFDRPEGERLASPVVPAPSPVSEVAMAVPTPTTIAAIGAVTPAGNWDALEAIEIALKSVQLRVAALPAASGVVAVSCGLERRRQVGAAFCTVISSAEAESMARSVVLAELARVTGASWSVEEIAAARRTAGVAWVLDTSCSSDMTVAYVRASAFGLPLDTVERYSERLESLPADGIRRAAAAILEPGRLGRGVVRGVASR